MLYGITARLPAAKQNSLFIDYYQQLGRLKLEEQ